MNDSEIVEHLISFIEDAEKDLQVNKLSADTQKKDVVKSILNELERVTDHEDK